MPSLMHLFDATNRSLNQRFVPQVLGFRCPRNAVNVTALRHVAVYLRLGLAFNRIKKNANSTTVILLREVETGRVEPEPTAKQHSWHLEKMPVVLDAAAPLLKFFVIVRNPYSRVLSAFLNKFAKAAYVERYRPYALTRDGFADFVSWLADGGLGEDPHWDLQSKLMLMPLDRYDRVIRFERYHEELVEFLATRGIDVERHPRTTSFRRAGLASSHADARLQAFYTPAVAGRVADLYANDFTALGYDTVPPC